MHKVVLFLQQAINYVIVIFYFFEIFFMNISSKNNLNTNSLSHFIFTPKFIYFLCLELKLIFEFYSLLINRILF
jgi:hypothetical protein